MKIFHTGDQEFTDYQGSNQIEINVYMKGGDGDCAWQHTQLFRTNNNDYTSKSLFVKVFLQ